MSVLTKLFRSSKTSSDYFNIGLYYKQEMMWKESIQANLKALMLDPQNEPALWNLGIAYTALGKYAEASTYWIKLGVETDKQTGNMTKPFSLVPIRLLNGEVIWCERLDPARAQINTVPLPNSNHRFNDILLTDGFADGSRRANNKDIPVFNEIVILKRSKYKTYSIKINTREEAIKEYLTNLTSPKVEIWSDTVSFISDKCSRSNYVENKDKKSTDDVLYVGIAADKHKVFSDFLRTLMSEFHLTSKDICKT